MMKLFEKRAGKKTRGQTMVEFALILPVLLMTMYGVMEFGRLLFIYVTTASATREAARYAAAVGISENGLPYYNDCAGIRAAAQRVGILAGIQDSDVVIQYDRGPGTTPYSTSCPAPGSGPGLGDRIVVTVTGHFDLIVPIGIVPISIQDITSSTARTIIRNVTVGDNFIIAPPIAAATPPPPYISFVEPSYSTIDEPGTEFDFVEVTIPVRKYDPDNTNHEPIVVTIDAVDIFEAKPGVDFVWPGPVTLTFDPGVDLQEFQVEIRHDDLYEMNERIVLYISNVLNANLGYPRLHVINIGDNDSGNRPEVAFRTLTSEVSEISPFQRIYVDLDRDTGVPVTVDFAVTGGTAVEGVDYIVRTDPRRLSFNILNNANRTVNRSAEILIEPIDNILLTGSKTVELTLIDPPTNALLGSPFVHTLTLIDAEECNISLTNPILDGNTFSINLLNAGINDYLYRIRLAFSHNGTAPQLNLVYFKNLQVASGSQLTDVYIPSVTFPWIVGADLSYPADGSPKMLSFQFSNTRVNGVNLTVDFENCRSISYP